MKKLTNYEFRNMWYSFWESKNHLIVESASLIPNDDPTILWVNAGVTPLKKYFDGSEVPENRRLANIQKCIRTNDIENVGVTARHQTFFEMLGNFSIGDYFRKEAINFAFEFLTSSEWLDIPLDKLYMTIYSEDKDTYNTWRSLGVEKDHIILLSTNFWEIGEGPCGPDSEIFYDRGEEYDPEHIGIDLLKKEIENDRYIEIWNNVFSQFNATEGLDRSNYPELPSKNIDTGMGLERILSILQGARTNFETDLFLPIMEKIEELSGVKYEGQKEFKIIADHTRAVVFALADGANFGNSGREYIVRRLLRRVVRYGRNLRIKTPFVAEIALRVVDVMRDAYPYLDNEIEKVIRKINAEEKLFNKTLISGEKRLGELLKNPEQVISGEDAFKLYDTYGFPFELTLEYATEAGFSVSREDFDRCMAEQKELARSAHEKISNMNVQNQALLSFDLESHFVGYDILETESKIIALFDGENFVDSIENEGYIVLDNTPFYVESGGQVSDEGIIIVDDNVIELVGGFKGPNKQFFHQVKFFGTLNVGDDVFARVDAQFRKNICRNHSATHLLQKSLQTILSEDVHQAGSKVDDKRLRFDFVYDGKITDEQLVEVEAQVQSRINEAYETDIREMTIDEARELGAMALFGEKYGNIVRVVTIGDSIELCGGTHVKNSSEIDKFAIISLESKGQNVYRIEATTADNIKRELFEAIKPYNEDMMKLLNKAHNILADADSEDIKLDFDVKINNDKPQNYSDILFNLEEVNMVKKAVALLEKEYMEKKSVKLLDHLDEFMNSVKVINNINTLILKLEGIDFLVLKNMIDTLENKVNGFVFIANVSAEKVNFIAKASKELSNVIDCGAVVKDASINAGGNGGGSKLFASGGGSNTDVVDDIIINVANYISSIQM